MYRLEIYTNVLLHSLVDEENRVGWVLDKESSSNIDLTVMDRDVLPLFPLDQHSNIM